MVTARSIAKNKRLLLCSLKTKTSGKCTTDLFAKSETKGYYGFVLDRCGTRTIDLSSSSTFVHVSENTKSTNARQKEIKMFTPEYLFKWSFPLSLLGSLHTMVLYTINKPFPFPPPFPFPVLAPAPCATSPLFVLRYDVFLFVDVMRSEPYKHLDRCVRVASTDADLLLAERNPIFYQARYRGPELVVRYTFVAFLLL